MSDYENFHDPFGLIWRMLRSGSSAARNALLREGVRQLLTPLDVMLSWREQRLINRLGTKPANHPIILVVGPPRSGTTLMYQVLSKCLDVAFPSNAASIFSRSPMLSSNWTLRWSQKGPSAFQSYYGQTAGLSDCNDGFHLWNRWLGDDRYRPVTSLSDEEAESMRRFFNAWTQLAKRPFLNKNNRNTAAITLLASHLPSVRFVVINRNPINVAQSLLLARQRIQGSKAIGWGLNAGVDPDGISPTESVCRQVVAVESQMEAQLQTVDADYVYRISYEAFCEQPRLVVDGIARRFQVKTVPQRFEALEPFSVADAQRVSALEYAEICAFFERTETPQRSV